MGMIIPAGDSERGQQRHGGAGCEGGGRGQCRLHGPRHGDLGDAELVACVGAERVLGHQLHRDLARELGSTPRLT